MCHVFYRVFNRNTSGSSREREMLRLEHNLLDISLDFFGSKRQLLLAEQVEGLHQNFYR